MVVTLRYASAIDLVPLISRLTGAEGAQAGQPADLQQRVTVVADPRSNSVLLRSENPARAARVKALIEQLDTPGRPGGNMFIVYLKNADATRVAQTLRALMTGGNDAPASAPAPSMISAQLGTAAPAAAAAPSTANPFTAGTSGGTGGSTPGGLTIQADTANNALIIMGPEPLYNNLRAIIERLDVRRAQVFVEALIVEVAADRVAEFGIQWQILQGIDKTNVQGFGGTNFGTRDSGNNIISGSINLGALGQGLNLGVIDGTVTIPGLGTITNLGFLARALETEAGANILSTPTLLTLDNEEARIIVGQNVPFVTGQYATTGGNSTVQPFQTIERRDVGVMLRVKPQITEGGTIRLGVYQEVSRIESFNTTTGLVLSKRALESSVIVDDKQVAVLGGLIQDTFSDGSDRVPLIGDIPFIGAFFRYDARKRQKVNLLVFLKPTVVRSSAQGRELTSERYDYIMGEQEKSRPQERFFWQDQTVPTLPEKGLMPGTVEGGLPSITPPPPLPVAPPPAPVPVPAPARLRPASASIVTRVAPAAVTARPNLPSTAASFAAQIPYTFAKAHGVLAAGVDGDAVVVLMRPDATADGVIELKRVLQRPLVTRAVGADAFAAELARAYNQAAPMSSALAGDLAADADLARLMQDMPVTEDLLDSTTQAPVIRMINALLLQALRERASDLHFEPYEATLGGALSRRRRAARRDRAAARAACGARVPAEDHGEPRHRGEAPAAGRPHRAEARRQAGGRAGVDAAHRLRRARGAAPARPGLRAPGPRGARHGASRHARRSTG